jgi:hypothetical protein
MTKKRRRTEQDRQIDQLRAFAKQVQADNVALCERITLLKDEVALVEQFTRVVALLVMAVTKHA